MHYRYEHLVLSFVVLTSMLLFSDLLSSSSTSSSSLELTEAPLDCESAPGSYPTGLATAFVLM